MLCLTTALPGAFHEGIMVAFTRYAGYSGDRARAGPIVTAPAGVRMPGCDVVQPDVMVVRMERAAETC